MIKLKRLIFKILFPHTAVILLLIPVSAVMLLYAFTEKKLVSAVQYAAYGLSAYTMTVLCAKAPVLYKKARAIKQENKYAVLYFSDAALRVKISLYGSFMINVLKNSRNESLGKNLYREYLNYRLCGIILLLMNITLSVIAFYIVSQNKGFTYHYIMTISMAAYTFTVFTTAVVNLIRYRKYNSPVISASKIINLVAAFVSMLSLETAMFTAFGEGNSPNFRKIMTACTGAAVCVIVLAMAIYMIDHSTKQLHQLEKESS